MSKNAIDKPPKNNLPVCETREKHFMRSFFIAKPLPSQFFDFSSQLPSANLIVYDQCSNLALCRIEAVVNASDKASQRRWLASQYALKITFTSDESPLLKRRDSSVEDQIIDLLDNRLKRFEAGMR
jgi:hypothetical protein